VIEETAMAPWNGPNDDDDDDDDDIYSYKAGGL